jgi:hypothetical protein
MAMLTRRPGNYGREVDFSIRLQESNLSTLLLVHIQPESNPMTMPFLDLTTLSTTTKRGTKTMTRPGRNWFGKRP